MDKHDELDAKLPLAERRLEEILGDAILASEFFEKQWEFITPVFSRTLLPRVFESETILPFLAQEFNGRGNFGDVFRYDIHLENQRFARGQQYVGKSIRIEEDEDRYHRELRNLSLLAQIKHPNIVELMCCYSYQKHHTFIFPVADHGDLGKLLEMPQRPVQFDSDEVFLVSLAELASALHAVHNFFSDVLDLHLTGYHHDLAPRNILVDGNKLLLADFGLSNFKDSTKASSTSFRDNGGYYIAPECQTLEGKIQVNRITRASDIWSFGCILLEVFIYMKRGAKGVQLFEEAREFPTAEFIFRRFHNGPNRTSPAVLKWMQELGTSASTHEAWLLHLISTMLSVEPSKRTKSAQVLCLLQLVAVKASSDAIQSKIQGDTGIKDDLEAVIEYQRFSSWAWGFEQLAEPHCRSSHPDDPPDPLDFGFTQIMEHIRNIDDLMAAGGRVEASIDQWYMFRSNNTRLLNLLPSGLRTQARNHLEAELLQTESTSLLEATRMAMRRADGDQMIGVLAAIRSMSLRAERQSLHIDPCLRIELGQLKIESDIGYHNLATLDTTPGPQQRVVIEWLKYDAKWSKEDVGEKLFSRIERITTALSSADQLSLPAALKSCGFCHDPGEHRFGQIYNVPPRYGQESKSITLGDVLKDARELHVPALQDRFRLAHRLVSSISAFHRIGWLHRGLHSSNVVFFLPNNCPPSQRIQYPSVLGFMHSRENE